MPLIILHYYCCTMFRDPNPRNFRGGVKERDSFVSGTPKLGLRWLFSVGKFLGTFRRGELRQAGERNLYRSGDDPSLCQNTQFLGASVRAVGVICEEEVLFFPERVFGSRPHFRRKSGKTLLFCHAVLFGSRSEFRFDSRAVML